MNDQVTISIRVPSELAQRIEALARATHRNRTGMIRHLLERALELEGSPSSESGG